MGGDLGPRSVVPACVRALEKFPSLELTLFGDPAEISAELHSSHHARLTLVECESHVTQEDAPAFALRHKRDSSMGCALQALADGRVDGMVSGGNTGALMALSCHFVGKVNGVRRPAIGKSLPTETGSCFLLDLGANIGVCAEDLLQFARMGVEAQKLYTDQRPLKVALLNIGSEAHKGTEEIRRAAELFREAPDIEYYGFIEGHDLFTGCVDVVVCDGMLGNIAMKSAEGVIRLMGQKVFRFDQKNAFKSFFGQMAIKLLRKWRSQLEPARYNGASFLGLSGNVIKSHGGASSAAFFQAIVTAVHCAEADLAGRVDRALS
ncbi:phosphate acyltransferase PlsX [Biformimicrobium ophioploci]|uniref:Phosphate acyltransferase n=2 Tax=Biformimicrobium ophioploci TaxID=3036711 RepID=A0ABQ6M1T5_9GAMM|nr:phosphate acyltransferase PlsX [Microbulbifer sp. NKW57]